MENGIISIDFANDSSHLTGDCINMGRQNWWKTGKDEGNLHFRPLNLDTESQFYLDCYADAWQIAHGDTDGFVPSLYLRSLKCWRNDHPESVAVGMDGDRIVGLVALDTRRSADQEKGWIGFIYLLPEYRGKRYGVQLLGYATTLYTRLGRKAVCLSVSEDNPHAQGFYRHTGFIQVGEAIGIGAPLLLMERPLGRGVLPHL